MPLEKAGAHESKIIYPTNVRMLITIHKIYEDRIASAPSRRSLFYGFGLV
jgi:hypothetical protein